MSGSTSHYGTPFKACINEAVNLSRHLMDRLVHRVAGSMPDRDAMVFDQKVRKLHTESMQALQKHRLAICDAFPKTLLIEFSRAMSNDTHGSVQKFDALDLVDEDKVLEDVEIARARQASRAAVEPVIGELNALICSAMGLSSVQENHNPLRPEIYVKALHAVLSAMDVSFAVRSRWIQFFGEALGEELSKDYAALSKLLMAAGVSKVEFKVLRAPEAADVLAAKNKSVPPVAAGEHEYIDELAHLAALRSRHKAATAASGKTARVDRQRGFAQTGTFSDTLPPGSDAPSPGKPTAPVASRRASPLASSRDGSSSLTTVRQEMKSSNHALALEVVSSMMGRIWDDSRLLPELRQAILRIEPALLRLAVADSLFISNQQHPARQLLQEITERGLAWRSAEREGFVQLLALVDQAVDALLDTKNVGPKPYAFVLQSMQKIWATQDERVKSKRDRDIEQLFLTEQRNGLARAIAISLRKRAQTVEVGPEIVEFLAGPWAQVIAQSRVTDESGRLDPDGYEDLVTDLLWSVMPAALANKSRLRKLVPQLLDRLNLGLMTIHYPQPKIKSTLGYFRDLYVAAIFPTQAVARSTPLSRRELVEEQLRQGDVEALWRIPDERGDSGFMETQPPQLMGVPLYENTQAGEVSQHLMTPSEESEEEIPADMFGPEVCLGCWIEFSGNGDWDRLQLTWSKPDRQLYMFTDEDGANRTFAAQALKSMLLNGQARMLTVANLNDPMAKTIVKRGNGLGKHLSLGES